MWRLFLFLTCLNTFLFCWQGSSRSLQIQRWPKSCRRISKTRWMRTGSKAGWSRKMRPADSRTWQSCGNTESSHWTRWFHWRHDRMAVNKFVAEPHQMCDTDTQHSQRKLWEVCIQNRDTIIHTAWGIVLSTVYPVVQVFVAFRRDISSASRKETENKLNVVTFISFPWHCYPLMAHGPCRFYFKWFVLHFVIDKVLDDDDTKGLVWLIYELSTHNTTRHLLTQSQREKENNDWKIRTPQTGMFIMTSFIDLLFFCGGRERKSTPQLYFTPFSRGKKGEDSIQETPIEVHVCVCGDGVNGTRQMKL